MLRAKKNRRDSSSKKAALSEAKKEETTRLNAIVPVSFHARLKQQALVEGRTVTDIVITVLDKYLRRREKGRAGEEGDE